MLPIPNKPILEHLLEEIKVAGITEFLFVVGYYAETVRNYFGNGEKWGVTIEYVSQMNQLGTACAVLIAEGRVNDMFLVINGDIVAKAEDIQRLTTSDKITLVLSEVNNPHYLGVVEVEEDRVRKIHEKEQKPSSRLANTGLYLLNPAIFTAIKSCSPSPRGEYELTDALQCLIDHEYQIRYFTTDYWLDLDYPWNLLETNELFLSKLENKNLAKIENNVTIHGKVSIGKDTQIKAGSYIEGPVVIGDQCSIGPFCYLRPGTVIGNNCHIGSTVEIKSSMIMNNTKISNHAFVGDSIIGEDCFIGSGTRIANIRFDGKNIKVAGIDTGRRELGAVIGDKVQTGINASIDAGTLIGNNSIVGPGAVPSGVILPDSKIF
jgi:bifunctional UDP-N-acetylglucosamine pyrophosphorylase/glucosamine-1-phosphate N-acetyltransferase